MRFVYAAAVTLLLLVLVASGSAQTLTIGFTVSRTGSLNLEGMEQLHGFELWRDQVNAAGGIMAGGKHYQVKFVSYDDESNVQRVQQLYTRLVLQDKAEFLFGPYSSGLTAPAAIVSEQNGRIMLTTAAEEKTYTLGNKYLFQVISPANEYMTSALDVLKAKDPNSRVALVYADDPFSAAVATATRAYAQKLGLKIIFDEAYAANTTDFGPIIDKIVSAKATALIGGGHYADGSTLARQIYAHKANIEFISLLVAPDSPQFAQLGEAANGVTGPSQWEPQSSFQPQIGPSSADFTRAYQTKYGIAPGYRAAEAYAAGLILQHAIEQAGSLDQDKVAAAMNATDLTTFYGRTKFATEPNRHGLQVAHTMILAQWQQDRSGKLEKQVVWPDAAKSAAIIFPLQHGQPVVAGK
ncbi:MAG: amino acid ABC transporter substrate-binding protein [Candidatus Korobacteraceae bacterium]|jgi:branched-chain amino acid transport system substrate-binding protein